MRHQKILLDLATEREIDRRRQRQTHSQRQGRSLVDRQPIPVQNMPVQRSRRRKRRLRRDRWKKLSILVPTVIFSLLLSRWLLPLSTQFSQAKTSRPQPVPINVSPVDVLSRAIISQESPNNHKSLNPHSQALGLAQVMPDNVGAWSQEALGYRLSIDEFRRNPTAQKQIINYKLEQYWQNALSESNGDEELAVLKVASHWYSGNPNLHDSKTTQWYKGIDGKLYRYPSVAKYSNSILQKYKQYIEEVRSQKSEVGSN